MRIRRKFIFNLFNIALAIILVFTSINFYPSTVTKADDNVVVSVQNQAYVDVLLSRGKTQLNTDTFETDLKAALVKEGIDTSYVNFIKNDSVVMVGSAGFNKYSWTFNSTTGSSGTRSTGRGDEPGPSAGSTSWQSTLGQFGFVGANLELVGNDRYGGNMILYSSMATSAYKYTMDFDYDSNFGDNFYGAGVFVQATLGSANSGILIYISRSTNDAGVYQGTINSNGSYSLGTKYASIESSGHLSITVSSGTITVNGTNIPGTYTGSNWGFFTNQYNHNCMYTGHFNFQNLIVNIETAKEFKKVLTEEQDNWTSGYLHVMVNCADGDTETSFKSSNSDYYNVLNLLNISEIHLLNWGTSSNQTTWQNYVNLLPNSSAFYNMGTYNSSLRQMSNYQACVNSTAKFIAELIKQNMNEDYVIIDNPTSITVSPNSARNVAKWSFEHDNTKLTEDIALDNDLGISDYQGAENVTFPSGFKFDKPGIYYISYDGQVVKKVTAHRLPTAVANLVSRTAVSGSTYNYVFESASFDIDSNEDLYGLGKGIKSLSWQYRVDGGSWVSAGSDVSVTIPINTDKNTDVQLTVTDFLGAQTTTTRTINAASKPVAYFSFASNPVSLYENISVIDSSYDPLGRTITSRTWVLKNSSGTTIYSSSTEPTFTPASKNMGVGEYTLSLTVKNSAGTSSYTYSATLTVQKVTANAIYQYNWEDANHSTYASSVSVEYLNKYPTLTNPTKYFRTIFDKNTGTEVSNSYIDATSAFNGWYKDEELTDKITSGTTKVTSTGNHYIYAKWTNSDITLPSAAKTYIVKFDANDTDLDKAVLNTASLTEDWIFNGWYKDAECTEYIGMDGDTVADVSENSTMYAGWTDVPVTLPEISMTYTITYDSNGGISSASDTQSVEFSGWYTSDGDKAGEAGSEYTVNSDHTLYAHWGTAEFTLSECAKDGAKFLGWYSLPQSNGKYNNDTDAVLVGVAGQTITLEASTTLYAWFNEEPVYTIEDLADFYEGQTITGDDLLTFVSADDIETSDASDELKIQLVSIIYNEEEELPVYEDSEIQTSTAHIGKFMITYSVTDYGIQINGEKIPDSEATVEKTLTFNLNYNDLPKISLNQAVYTYTSDETLTEDTITDFIKLNALMSDKQDETDNKPWWDITESFGNLINSLEIVSVKDISINPAYEIENRDMAAAIKEYTTVEEIYALKDTDFEAFSAITSYKVTLDAVDQWGKYSSGKISDKAAEKGVVAQEKDAVQSAEDRTITVICTDDASYNNIYTSVRDVNEKYVSSVIAKSYWGDTGYGGKILKKILALRENKDSLSAETYEAEYEQTDGDTVNIIINDYTGNLKY